MCLHLVSCGVSAATLAGWQCVCGHSSMYGAKGLLAVKSMCAGIFGASQGTSICTVSLFEALVNGLLVLSADCRRHCG